MVQVVGIVEQEGDRPLLGAPSQEAEGWRPHRETVGLVSVLDGQGDPQGPRLWGRHPLELGGRGCQREGEGPFAWMTDFVGWLPMAEGGSAEAALTADYNAEMLEQRERFRWVRDRSVFVGNEGDVNDGSFGPGLPGIRDWTSQNHDVAGFVTGFEPTPPEDRGRLRSELGYRNDERVCVVTVGGSGVGEALLRRVLDAVPLVRRAVPDLRFLVVTGPQIDPTSTPRQRGVTVRGYVPDLVRHLAACDVAVVEGGLTTCMELTANRRPFVYVPLRRHFEQNLHVRHRLEGYRAGTFLDYALATDPDALAATIIRSWGGSSTTSRSRWTVRSARRPCWRSCSDEHPRGGPPHTREDDVRPGRSGRRPRRRRPIHESAEKSSCVPA